LIIPARLESPITEAEYRRFFEACASEQAHAVLVAETPENFAHRSLLLKLARDYRLVGMYPTPDFARSGGVIAYGRDIADPMRRMAHYVNQIIKGAKPGDLPFEQPTRLHLVINLKTATALGLTIPPTLLARADEVIE
jgi:putative tryptophan/tyrosine transport system substrate-binding protein